MSLRMNASSESGPKGVAKTPKSTCSGSDRGGDQSGRMNVGSFASVSGSTKRREDSVSNRKLQDAENTIRLLEKRVKDLELQLANERQLRNTPAARSVGARDPFMGGYSSNAVQTRYPPPSPLTFRQAPPFSPFSPHAPPYTPTASRPAVGSPMMSTPNSARRHKRTETPEQLFLKPYTNGEKIYTMGMDPQADRGLLLDFFDEIRSWAACYAADLDAQEVARCSSFADLVTMINGKSDIQHLLSDKETLGDIIAALVTRHIVMHAMGEVAMVKSAHRRGEECRELFSQFVMLSEKDISAKHALCVQQQDLYKKIYTESGHKKWRTTKADQYACKLLIILAPFLKAGKDENCEHRLGELYVKGYRIGIRLRSEPLHWQIIFPVAGMKIDLDRMVNQTRNLVGDAMTTLQKLREEPSNYVVRFSITPTVIKSDFSTGTEVKTVVHSSMVHVGRKGIYSHKTLTKN